MTQLSERYTWRCNQCGSKLTDQQVKVYQQKLVLHGLDVGSCNLCGGHAVNMEQVQEHQRKQVDFKRINQQSCRKNQMVLFASLAALVAMPGILTFVCAVLLNLQFGILKSTHVKMKMGALMLTAAACFSAVLVGAAGYVSIGLIMPGNGLAGWFGSLMVWGLALVVMGGTAVLIEQSGNLGGKLYY